VVTASTAGRSLNATDLGKLGWTAERIWSPPPVCAKAVSRTHCLRATSTSSCRRAPCTTSTVQARRPVPGAVRLRRGRLRRCRGTRRSRPDVAGLSRRSMRCSTTSTMSSQPVCRGSWDQLATLEKLPPCTCLDGKAAGGNCHGRYGDWRFELRAFVSDFPVAYETLLVDLVFQAKSGLTARRAPVQQHPGRTGIDHAVFRDTTFGGAVAADVLPLELSRCVCVGVD
jgi:hypothetical protein